METEIESLRKSIAELTRNDERNITPIPGLSLYRTGKPDSTGIDCNESAAVPKVATP